MPAAIRSGTIYQQTNNDPDQTNKNNPVHVSPGGRAGIRRLGKPIPANGDTTKQPVKTIAAALGTVVEKLPATEGAQTVMVTALIDVPAAGNYTVLEQQHNEANP